MAAEPEGMDVRLLGPVRARRDGIDLPLGSARRLAVFSVLALQAGQSVSREQMVTALWGDEPPASAVGNVYTYVSSLRQALEPARDRWSAGQILTSGGGSYCLHVREQDVDAFRFEALRDESRRHRTAGDRLAELAALEAALKLWGGEALAGVPGPYAASRRLRLTELRLASAERHAALLVELGRHEDAIAALRPLVDEFPMQETLHGMLMAALNACGRRSEALQVHDKLSEVLLRESGTEPSAALRTMRLRILTGVERPRPTSLATAPPVESPAQQGLVGRVEETRLLRAALRDVTSGRGSSIRVEGHPGMGKTALLTAAVRSSLPPGAQIGWGVGGELAGRMPLGVLLECLESATIGDPDRTLVKQLFAIAADAISGQGETAVERAVGLVRQAATAPVVLVADDLHHADPLTLRVWSALLPLTRELPLLLVASARPGATALAGVPADHVVPLGPLPADAATALVRGVSPEPFDPRALHGLLAEAGGNPYYLRHLAAAGTRDGLGERGAPPPGLVRAINAHLAPLTEETRHILRAVAFLGDSCTLGEVAAVTDYRIGDLAEAVRPAYEAGILTDTGGTLAFRHRVVARVLHESTPAALRIVLHRSFAQKIADCGGTPERVVSQLLAGPVPLDAAASRWLREHIEQLARRAPQVAVSMLKRVRTEYALDAETRLELTAWLARLLYAQRSSAVAEAGWVAARTADPQLEAEMQWITAGSHDRLGEHVAAADVARAVLSARRLTPEWLDRFRLLIDRLRPHLPGEPTVPHMSRSMLLGDLAASSR